jgi:hypothetical protein
MLCYPNKKSLYLECEWPNLHTLVLMVLNNQQPLHVVARTPRVHSVPRRVRQRTADSPHNGDSGFGGSWKSCVS